MKRKILILVVALVLALSTSVAVYAAPVEEGIVPYETDSVSFVTTRTSATVATASIHVGFSQQVDQYSIVIYLQKLSNGSWVLDTTNEDYVSYNNGWNARSVTLSKKYDKLKHGVIYRLKCVSKDYIGNSSYITTSYSDSF